MSKRISFQRKCTDPLKVPVCNLVVMEVLETLNCPVQLSPQLSEESDGQSEATYQFQSIGVMIFDIFHDGSMHHPF